MGRRGVAITEGDNSTLVGAYPNHFRLGSIVSFWFGGRCSTEMGNRRAALRSWIWDGLASDRVAKHDYWDLFDLSAPDPCGFPSFRSALIFVGLTGITEFWRF
jgi:hypothetical protein